MSVIRTRVDTLVARNLSSALQHAYVAEAGLQHAIAEIPSRVSPRRILSGPDGIVPSADDGLFPFRAPAPLLIDGLSYRVEAKRLEGVGIELLSTLSGSLESKQYHAGCGSLRE